MNSSALKTQVGGRHYKDYPIQPVEFCQRNRIPFCEASAIKYLCRHRSKNGIEDLKKARHFIDLLIEIEYGGEESQALEREQEIDESQFAERELEFEQARERLQKAIDERKKIDGEAFAATLGQALAPRSSENRA